MSNKELELLRTNLLCCKQWLGGESECGTLEKAIEWQQNAKRYLDLAIDKIEMHVSRNTPVPQNEGEA